MAIKDRNLSVGTKLWARYKGEIHTAEVVLNAKADDESGRPIAYRLSDGREFKSPSAAGTAITEKSCNGWAFWTVGEASEEPKIEEPAPKASRSRKKKDAPQDSDGEVLPIVEQVDGQFECGNCGASFATTEEAATHVEEAHPAK